MELKAAGLFNTIKDFDGNEFTRDFQLGSETKNVKLTLKDAIRMCLVKPISIPDGQGRKELHEDKKFECYELARKIDGADVESVLEISTQDGTLIKERAAKFYAAEIYAPIHNWVEGKIA